MTDLYLGVKQKRGVKNPLKIKPFSKRCNITSSLTHEACIRALGIEDICHFTSRDIGYYPFYFQGNGILCSIFWLLSGILKISGN